MYINIIHNYYTHIIHILYTYYTHIIHILYTYYTHIIHILYTYYTHIIHILNIIHILYTYYTHIIHILYTYYTHIIHILYTYYTHIIHILYTYYTHIIHMLYTYYTHIIHILYTYYTHIIHTILFVHIYVNYCSFTNWSCWLLRSPAVFVPFFRCNGEDGLRHRRQMALVPRSLQRFRTPLYTHFLSSSFYFGSIGNNVAMCCPWLQALMHWYCKAGAMFPSFAKPHPKSLRRKS